MIRIIEKEDYVPYELARLLKEKGFDWECIGYYVDYEPNDVHYSFCGETNSTWESRCCSAPTHQMAMKWLREVHNILIQVELYSKLNDYCFEVFKNTHRMIVEKDEVYNTYEQAVEEAIKYCLENLI